MGVRDQIASWEMAASQKYGDTHEWTVWVGDISNMYDELDPGAAVDAVDRLLAIMPAHGQGNETSHTST